jgi:hypothetical protein
LVGKLEVLRSECTKCVRRGQYPVATLVRELGADAMLTYFREWLTRDCPRVIAARYSEALVVVLLFAAMVSVSDELAENSQGCSRTNGGCGGWAVPAAEVSFREFFQQ